MNGTWQEHETALGGPRDFQTTHWSVVLAAGQNGSPQADAALAKLCQTYWYPLYAFIRRRGFDPERAKDLTQEFFARLLEKNFLMAADREKGRFRSFLLACVQHFLSKELKKERALKRGGGYTFISLDEVMAEGRYAQEPVDRMSPEKIYERGWGLTLLDQALARLKREYVADEKSGLFEALHIFLSGARQAPGSYAEIGVRLNMTESAVRQAAYRMRFRFGVLLRWEVAHTVANPREIEDELGHLLTIMSN